MLRSKTDCLIHTTAPTELTRREAFSPIVHVSRKMCELIIRIEYGRNCLEPMLITGETGAGKEVLARAIHEISPRREGKFIPFNCATATRELIESRLAGHQRGSFTGADRNINGIVREASGGTLLLDEVGDLSLDAQPILLRILQEGEVHPLGAPRPVKTDVRVIAATNRDLEADVRSGRFRADLYQRLKALWAHIPPLRERREDIRPLIEYFLKRREQQYCKHGLRLSDEAWALMSSYDWPGNVRELENVVLRLVVSAESGEEIVPERVLPEIKARANVQPASLAEIIEGGLRISFNLPFHDAIDEVKRLFIINALTQTNGNRSQAASILGMNRDGLRRTIKRLNIQFAGDD